MEDEIGAVGADHAEHGVAVPQVEQGAGRRQHLVVACGLEGGHQLPADLPASPGDRGSARAQPSAARALSGSHHQRLSRYHSTVAARPGLEIPLGRPAQRPQLGAVDRVAAVVTEAVGHVLDGRLVPAAQRHEAIGQLPVGHLVAPADVVDLADLAPPEDRVDAGAVVLDVEPVPHVEAVAVERHPQPVEQVRDEQRDDLLGELEGPVVVRRPGGHDRQAVGGHVGQGDEVRPGLGGRVRRARLRAGRSRATTPPPPSRRPRRWRCAGPGRPRAGGPRRTRRWCPGSWSARRRRGR